MMKILVAVAFPLLAAAADTCIQEYGQCGGINHKGSTSCCSAADECVYQSDYFSQCQPLDPAANDTCVTAYGQCAGINFNNGTKKDCCFSLECIYSSDYYSQCTDTSKFVRSTPAEIDEQAAIWIGWPSYNYMSNYSAVDVVVEMITALCNSTQDACSATDTDLPACSPIVIQAPAGSALSDATSKLTAAGLLDCVAYFDTSDRGDAWLRDIGPVFTGSKASSSADTFQSVYGLDFNFNGYSAEELLGTDVTALDEGLDRSIYTSLLNLTVYNSSSLIGEGGNRDFNGEGTLLMNVNVERLRNQDSGSNWTLSESETIYTNLFGVSNIVWVDGVLSTDAIGSEPLTYGDNSSSVAFNWGTGGHLTKAVRFTSADTVVVASISDDQVAADTTGLLAQDQATLESIYQLLKTAVDQNGDSFNVIQAPSAPLFFSELTLNDQIYSWFDSLDQFQEALDSNGSVKTVASASYMEFVVTNRVVLIPAYYTQGDATLSTLEVAQADAEFLGMMKALFPDHTIVQINPLALNFGGGGMHGHTAHQQEFGINVLPSSSR